MAQIFRLQGHKAFVLADPLWLVSLTASHVWQLASYENVDNQLSIDQLNSAFTPHHALLVIHVFNPASEQSAV